MNFVNVIIHPWLKQPIKQCQTLQKLCRHYMYNVHSTCKELLQYALYPDPDPQNLMHPDPDPGRIQVNKISKFSKHL